MTIYAAAFSTKELSYDDFFFLLAHYKGYGVTKFVGSIDYIKIRSAEGTYAYVFRGLDDHDIKDMAIVLMFSHDNTERSAEENVHLMNKHEEAITVFVSTLAVLAEPNDLESFCCTNGNAVTVLKDINTKKISDLFVNGARQGFATV